MSFFFSAIYSESMFLLLSIASLLSARRDRWALAGFLALLAALTRSAGVVLFIPLAVLAWDSGQRWRMGWALLPLAGPAAFAAYLEIDGPGWRAAFDAQRIWGREFAGPFVAAWDGATAAAHGALDVLRDGGGRLAHQNVFFFAFLVLAVMSLIGVLRRLPRAYGAWVLAALAVPLSYPVEGTTAALAAPFRRGHVPAVDVARLVGDPRRTVAPARGMGHERHRSGRLQRSVQHVAFRVLTPFPDRLSPIPAAAASGEREQLRRAHPLSAVPGGLTGPTVSTQSSGCPRHSRR